MLPEANILAEYRKLCPDYIPRENHVNDECYDKFRCAFKRGWDIGYSDGWKDRKTEEFKKGYSPTSETEKPKPSLGLRPKYVFIAQRINEILEAIGRYANEGKQIPPEWLIELQELTGNKPGEKKNFIVYYEPGATYFIHPNDQFCTTGGQMDNTTIAKRLCDLLGKDYTFQVPHGFRIAQKINGEFKEIFPDKENQINVHNAASEIQIIPND